MSERLTPFALVFADLAPPRFSEIRQAAGGVDATTADRDRFVLLAPVGQLLRELAPDDAPPDAIEAYVRLMHHAYRYWAAGGVIYDVAERTLERAIAASKLSSAVPHPAFYLRLPPLRVWGTAREGEPPEPLDGMFVTATLAPGAIAVLGVFGMHGERPGFSAVAVEGRADENRATAGEAEVAPSRDDGSPLFAPLLSGGREAAVHSVADAGEMLLLVCRLLPLLPPASPSGPEGSERIIAA